MVERLFLDMEFPARLARLRKNRGMTQHALSEAAGVNVSQIRRYEGGTSQPTLEVLRKLAIALSVSADVLLFDKDERGPDEDLKLQFEAVSRLDPDEKKVIKEVVESMIIKHDAGRWIRGRDDHATSAGD